MWESFVERNAAHVSANQSDWWDAVGGEPWSADGPVVWGVSLTEPVAGRVAHATGLTVERIQAMQLSSLAGVLFDLDALTAGGGASAKRLSETAWVSPKSVRACRACLIETGGQWPIIGKYWGNVMCAEHGLLLAQICEECGLPLRSGSKKISPNDPRLIPDPLLCANHRPVDDVPGSRRHRRCGAPLAESVAAVPVANDDPLTAAQRTVNDLLHRGLHDDWNLDLSTLDAFAGLRGLNQIFQAVATPDLVETRCATVRQRFNEFTEERTRVGRPQGVPTWTTGAREVMVIAAGTPTAVRIVTAHADQRSELMAPLAELAVARQRNRIGSTSITDGNTLPAALLPAWKRAVADARGSRPGFTLQINVSRPLTPGHPVTTANIPGSLGDADHARFAGLIPGRLDRTCRVFEAMTCARIVTGGAWPACAEALGIPGRTGALIADHITRQTTALDTTDAVLSAARAVLDDWATLETLPDYGIARAGLRDFNGFDPKTWKQLCRTAGVHAGNGGRVRYAAIWMWADATGSCAWYAPTMLAAERDGARRDHLRERYHVFTLWLPPSLADALRDHGRGLITGSQSEGGVR